MKIKKEDIKRILVITLSNLGDVVLTTPVIEVLLREYPYAQLDVIVGPNGAALLQRHPKISDVIVYDKFMPFAGKRALIATLRKRHYSLIIDLRNTLYPYLIGAAHKSLPFKRFTRHITHKKDVHLWKLRIMGISISDPPVHLHIDDEDRQYIQSVLKYLPTGKLVVVNAGAKSHLKRWPGKGFVHLVNELKKDRSLNIVMIGAPEDERIVSTIVDELDKGEEVLNLAGKTTVRQLVALLEQTDLLITNDTAPLHIASLLGKKVLALFGPTDPKEYGPLSEGSVTLRAPLVCVPCKKAHCAHTISCMHYLKKEKALHVAREMLAGKTFAEEVLKPRRLLLSRTDRIGDVALSTPAMRAVWEHFANAYIACMVQPYTREIVEGSPYLDEIVVLDKRGEHRGLLGMIRFAGILRRDRFDTALILHPTNRVHLVTFLAGIPERVGYNRKMGFLLTKRLPHTKQQGKKHELEYTLDVVRSIGVEPHDTTPFIAVDSSAQIRVAALLKEYGVSEEDVVVGMHPGASCPSKRWPPEKFADVAEQLIDQYHAKVVVVAGRNDSEPADKVVTLTKERIVNFAGRLSVKELAAFMKRCKLFISNDSGPVHVASAVGTPVISIFGRNEQGLSPARWRPLGKNDVVIHKDVGCRQCLAHNCKKDFECLRSIETDDILETVRDFLS